MTDCFLDKLRTFYQRPRSTNRIGGMSGLFDSTGYVKGSFVELPPHVPPGFLQPGKFFSIRFSSLILIAMFFSVYRFDFPDLS